MVLIMQLMAHRGASLDAPENTLAAFQLAWQQEADGIEGDFRLSADGHLVCLHDAHTGRIGSQRLEVATSTLAELQTVDVGAWKGNAFRFEVIPTLPAILGTMPPNKRFLIEVKDGPASIAVLARDLAAGPIGLEWIDILAFDKAVIRQARALIPGAKAYWLSELKPGPDGNRPTPDEVIAGLRECGADGLDAHAGPGLTPEVAAVVRHEGYGLYAWTVDTLPQALACHGLGVQGLTTNAPGALRELIPPRLLG